MYECRLIVSEPASGAMNMALDEAMLESASQQRNDIATLRIYSWAKPTLSLGYFQRAADRELHPDSGECELIRRPSGGGAILHDRELTYALVLPAAMAKGEAASGWYFKVHDALIAAIAELTGARAVLCENPPQLNARDEPFLCFQRRAAGDVLLGEHKIAGSAQRRRSDAILQHGSVLLQTSPHAPELPGISDLSHSDVTFESLADRFVASLSQRLNFDLQIAQPTEGELNQAGVLSRQKYDTSSWTSRR